MNRVERPAELKRHQVIKQVSSKNFDESSRSFSRDSNRKEFEQKVWIVRTHFSFYLPKLCFESEQLKFDYETKKSLTNGLSAYNVSFLAVGWDRFKRLRRLLSGALRMVKLVDLPDRQCLLMNTILMLNPCRNLSRKLSLTLVSNTQFLL